MSAIIAGGSVVSPVAQPTIVSAGGYPQQSFGGFAQPTYGGYGVQPQMGSYIAPGFSQQPQFSGFQQPQAGSYVAPSFGGSISAQPMQQFAQPMQYGAPIQQFAQPVAAGSLSAPVGGSLSIPVAAPVQQPVSNGWFGNFFGGAQPVAQPLAAAPAFTSPVGSVTVPAQQPQNPFLNHVPQWQGPQFGSFGSFPGLQNYYSQPQSTGASLVAPAGQVVTQPAAYQPPINYGQATYSQQLTAQPITYNQPLTQASYSQPQYTQGATYSQPQVSYSQPQYSQPGSVSYSQPTTQYSQGTVIRTASPARPAATSGGMSPIA